MKNEYHKQLWMLLYTTFVLGFCLLALIDKWMELPTLNKTMIILCLSILTVINISRIKTLNKVLEQIDVERDI